MSRVGERSKSCSISDPVPGVEPEVKEPEPLLNGEIKPGKTPVVSINNVAAERDGAISPKTTLVSSCLFSVGFLNFVEYF